MKREKKVYGLVKVKSTSETVLFKQISYLWSKEYGFIAVDRAHIQP